jgi:hypothetical protein
MPRTKADAVPEEPARTGGIHQDECYTMVSQHRRHEKGRRVKERAVLGGVG